MRISQRLFLAVLPAVIGIFTVAGLAYWGKYERQAPEAVIVVAIIAAVVSLGMAWYNTRYVAHRVERLAASLIGTPPQEAATASLMAQLNKAPALRDIASAVTAGVISRSSTPDELDKIETTMAGLNSAVARARVEGESRAQSAETRLAEYTELTDDLARLVASRLEEAEMPLHVLLSSPFGSLNDNQEELLADAQAALDTADMEVRRLRKLLELDRGAVPIIPQPIGLPELLKPVLAIAMAQAHAAHIDMHTQISDSAPRAVVDPVHTQAALTALLTNAVARTPTGGEIDVEGGEDTDGRIRITITGDAIASSGRPPLDVRLARRQLALQHASLTQDPRAVVMTFPGETVSRVKTAKPPHASPVS